MEGSSDPWLPSGLAFSNFSVGELFNFRGISLTLQTWTFDPTEQYTVPPRKNAGKLGSRFYGSHTRSTINTKYQHTGCTCKFTQSTWLIDNVKMWNCQCLIDGRNPRNQLRTIKHCTNKSGHLPYQLVTKMSQSCP